MHVFGVLWDAFIHMSVVQFSNVSILTAKQLLGVTPRSAVLCFRRGQQSYLLWAGCSKLPCPNETPPFASRESHFLSRLTEEEGVCFPAEHAFKKTLKKLITSGTSQSLLPGAPQGLSRLVSGDCPTSLEPYLFLKHHLGFSSGALPLSYAISTV